MQGKKINPLYIALGIGLFLAVFFVGRKKNGGDTVDTSIPVDTNSNASWSEWLAYITGGQSGTVPPPPVGDPSPTGTGDPPGMIGPPPVGPPEPPPGTGDPRCEDQIGGCPPPPDTNAGVGFFVPVISPESAMAEALRSHYDYKFAKDRGIGGNMPRSYIRGTD